MEDNNKPNNSNKKPFKWTMLIGPILLMVVFGLLFYWIFSSAFTTKVYKSFGPTEFVCEVDSTGNKTYSGDIYELVKDHNEGEQYGKVESIKSYYIPDGHYYYFEAEVQTRVQNSSGQSYYTTYLYSFNIAGTDEEYNTFLEFLKTTTAGQNNLYSVKVYSTADYSWLYTLLIFLGIGLLAVFFLRNMVRGLSGGPGGKSGLFDNGFKGNKKATKSDVRFSDVAGIDEVKNELVEVVDYFTNAKKYKALGAILPKGVLLVGPPGTGKTLLAKAVAGEANVPFYSISGSDFVEMYVGVGASRVRDMFKTAKANAPCLVFIDEIDAVGRQRGAGLGGGNDEREQTLNQLLVEMDGFEDSSGVIIMAATNRSDVLDPALTRPGRFDRIITVDYPDKDGREAILKVHSRNKKVSKDVDYDAIARNTVGFAGADLANIMNEAAILAVRENRDEITYKDIDEAIDRRIAGPAKDNKHLEEKERWQVAYHESGHAIVGLKVPYSNKVQKITIIPRGRTGGHVLMTPENDKFLQTKNELMAEITGFLAGRTSEEIFFGDVSTGASNDFEQATKIARAMVTRFGMSKLGPVQYDQSDGNVFLGRDYGSYQRNYSDQVALEIDNEVRRIIEECHKQAYDIITQYKDDVELLAKTVFERETINASEIKELLEKRTLPPIPKKPSAEVVNFYRNIHKVVDNMIAHNVTNFCIIIAKDDEADLTMTEVSAQCKANELTNGRVGVIFITKDEIDKLIEAEKKQDDKQFDYKDISTDVERYSNGKTLLLFGSPNSVASLKNKQNPTTSTFKKQASEEKVDTNNQDTSNN